MELGRGSWSKEPKWEKHSAAPGVSEQLQGGAVGGEGPEKRAEGAKAISNRRLTVEGV